MTPPPIVFHTDYEIPLRPGHRFPMTKYGYLKRILDQRGLADRIVAPVEAGEGVITLAHDPGYVSRVVSRTLSDTEVRRIGLPLTEALVRRVRLSSAGTLLAARLALEEGRALNAAGGSHHAMRAAGAGYCVLNDVAVAAASLLAEGLVARVLVLDLDVHQGDGTAKIFADDPRVFTVSLHGEKNFPARKAQSDIDLALADGLDDTAYLSALDEVLRDAEARFQPDLIFYNAGVDVHRDDRLGRLGLSDAGIRARDARAFAWAGYLGAPIVGVLGGGYGPDPALIAARHALMFEEAGRGA